MRRYLVALAALLLAFCAHAADVDAGQTQALHALFERQWEDSARRFPEGSTFRGETRYNDLLSDQSPAAIGAADLQVRRWLAEAKTVTRESLSPVDRVSLDLFIGQMERQLEEQAFPGYRSMRVSALGGVQADWAELMKVTPMRNRAQAQQLLRRMAAYPLQMDQEIALMRSGEALGWVPAKDVLDRVLAQIDGQLQVETGQSAFYEPFLRLGSDIAGPDRAALQAAGRTAVESEIVPAMRRLRAFIASEALAHAPASGSLRNYPDGERVYAMVVRQQTTTSLSPAEIHAIGLRELGRLRAEMEAVMSQVKFEGDFGQFVRFLETDPRFFHTSPQALLAGYREIAKRIDAELPRLFAELPRAPYGVRSMPAFQGPDAAEYYDPPARDGSRAGYFNANTLGWRTRPTWRMATLVAHEAVPGHHLQIARAIELRGLPQFRRGNAGPRDRPVRRSVQPVRPSAVAGFSRRPAGRRHRYPSTGLEPAAGDRLHGRAHRFRARLCHGRSGPLHIGPRPGARLHDRKTQDRGTARACAGAAG
jgi:uncharacterized protein (DUF885 family)